MNGITVWLAKKILPGIIIYMVVSSWAVSQGVDPTVANIIGAAAGFGTISLAITGKLPKF
ncbi:MAG: hypothetical protein V1900_01925 [Candidatus Aenigmatarchaeota archaeon]